MLESKFSLQLACAKKTPKSKVSNKPMTGLLYIIVLTLSIGHSNAQTIGDPMDSSNNLNLRSQDFLPGGQFALPPFSPPGGTPGVDSEIWLQGTGDPLALPQYSPSGGLLGAILGTESNENRGGYTAYMVKQTPLSADELEQCRRLGGSFFGLPPELKLRYVATLISCVERSFSSE